METIIKTKNTGCGDIAELRSELKAAIMDMTDAQIKYLMKRIKESSLLP